MHGQFSYPEFYSVYLDDWRVKRPLLPPHASASPSSTRPKYLSSATMGDWGEALLDVDDAEGIGGDAHGVRKIFLPDEAALKAGKDGVLPPPMGSVDGFLASTADHWDVDFGRDLDPALSGPLTRTQRCRLGCIIGLKLVGVFGALYFFICALSFLADAFRLVAGRQAGEIFQNSEIFNNPVAGMLVGVLVTVLVQSSSTSTSIFITMVASDLLTVKQAIRLIMGANIGTSVTSTIVALGQSGNRNEFRRAFAAATVHDMFNFLCVLVMLPLEVVSGYLFELSLALINATPGLTSGEEPPEILSRLTKPFTTKILTIDKKLITRIATGEADASDDSLSMIKTLFGHDDVPGSDDQLVGVVTLVLSLLVLCLSLYVIVLLLKSILKGHIALWLHKSVNGQVPDLMCGGGHPEACGGRLMCGSPGAGKTVTVPMGWLSGYLAMAVGFGLTICVQSSSITTSALTPLVGIGVLSLERMYPVVLGANIGTTITGVLAALAADGSKLYLTLQVAYSHLFFNLTGIFLFYTIWPLRALPINAAKFMGNTTAEYRWFALAYLAVCFFIIPAIFMGFAFAGDVPIIVLITLCVLVAVFVAVVNVLQFRRPQYLPIKLRSWLWLPEPLRSLRPYDQYIFAPLGKWGAKCCTCKQWCKTNFKSKHTRASAHEVAALKDVKVVTRQSGPNPDELAVAAERLEAVAATSSD